MTAPGTRDPLMTHDIVAATAIGVGAAVRSLSRLGATRNGLILVDRNVHAQHPSLSSRARHVIVFDPRHESQPEILERAHAEIRRQIGRGGEDTSASVVDGIVGIGGGSVMDAAKLLRLLLLSAASFRSACHAAESFGVSIVPEGWTRGAPKLALIPTTLGTGSEASAVACLHGEGPAPARRLVTGRVMRADTVVLDPGLTRSLPDRTVREGAAEILLRILGAYIGSPERDVPDRAAEELAARVAALAETGVRRGFDDRIREALAVASAETHTGWALVGRDPFAAKHWYLANELSSAAQLGKVPVTLGLLPEIWRRIVDGDSRLGDASRLRRLWRIVSQALSLTEDPACGAEEWVSDWGLAPPLVSRDAIARAARGCFEVWGGERPALRGLGEADVLSIYVVAFGETRMRCPLSTVRKEVN
jgi:NADP-dependent alcohol dehydrogenase